MIDIRKQAADYARKTTNTRCSKMGDCDECKVLYCDYRSRYVSYMRAVIDIGCTRCCEKRRLSD